MDTVRRVRTPDHRRETEVTGADRRMREHAPVVGHDIAYEREADVERRRGQCCHQDVALLDCGEML